MQKIEVHGSYPFDSGRWVRVSNLKPLEAAKLLGVLEQLTPEDKKKAKSENLYLFLNKGYVVLDKPEMPPFSSLLLVLIENTTGGEVGFNLPVGTRAIYLHDGRYSLIELR